MTGSTESQALLSQQPPFTSSNTTIDPLTTTAQQLQAYLNAGTVTTQELVDVYLSQIEKHNKDGLKLNAILQTAPYNLISQYAKSLDAERAAGKARGPLHGIPIIIKDNIMTDWKLGMDTTCGSYALRGAKAPNAPVIDKILSAGMVIIAKASLSEWAATKGFGLTTGWSALGGQVQTPYVKGGFKTGDLGLGHSTPCGSSSGSAVGVAAGFAPLTVATETDGSVTQPAGRAALFALKVTVGSVNTSRTSPTSPFTDSLGGMAKSAGDLALLATVLTEQDYSSFLTGSWHGQRIAAVDPKLWNLHPVVCEYVESVKLQQDLDFHSAIETIRKSGGVVIEDVVLPQVADLLWEGEDALEFIWGKDLKSNLESFLAEYEDAEVRTVEELVQFNKDHADVELPPGRGSNKAEADDVLAYPGQQQLENALENPTSEATKELAMAATRKAAKDNGFDRIFAETDTDLLMGPLDGRVVTVAAAAGYPCGVVPLGYADNYNGRPYGAVFVGRAGSEGRILQAMSAWEATMPARRPPPLLVGFKSAL
ncbi:putative amidase [Lachnellula suecica]|uniref:Putative amidase n=1 Tax=Lachnellula suecica TaxID=602035 RepID=A0A8T9C3E7_9HELO|nr:putative amidase [Lachnellula suecica]